MSIHKKFCTLALIALCSLFAGCQGNEPLTATPTTTLFPTQTQATVSCADLDREWNTANWKGVLDVLTRLENAGVTCGIESLKTKRYAAYIYYATQLEGNNETALAVEQYRAALALDGQREEALRALLRLNALPPPTSAPCAPQALPAYVPSQATYSFARVQASQIVVDGKPYRVRGINYYPRNAPWQGFIAGSDLSEIKQELDLIAARGFNTLRIFLWYDALFQCASERATPNVPAFEKLDVILHYAAERNLRLIVTLNDLPDFYFRPIYTDWAHYDAQTTFLVKRYRDDPGILAWDVRNEGDIDYGANGQPMPNTTRAQVLTWLEHATKLVRANDPNHWLTAGWLSDPLETEPFVDVLSLHHWSSEAGLAERIRAVRAQTSKPLLVEEMGLAGMGHDGEAAQADHLPQMIETADQNGTAGWLIWTAFDFFVLPDAMASPEYRFGIWRNDLSAKPVLDRLPVPTRSP